MSSLRLQLRHRRKALAPAYRESALQNIIKTVLSIPQFIQAQTIAGYIGFDGEVDALPLLELAVRQSKQCFIPRIHHELNKTTMEFVPFSHVAELVANQYGILESLSLETYPPQNLDLVLTPLVGFNQDCHRLGMGKGYYDRCFEFIRTTITAKKRPFMLGLAYDCQFSNAIPLQDHDVPLDAIITESRILVSTK